jgi:hypothetical protein
MIAKKSIVATLSNRKLDRTQKLSKANQTALFEYLLA